MYKSEPFNSDYSDYEMNIPLFADIEAIQSI